MTGSVSIRGSAGQPAQTIIFDDKAAYELALKLASGINANTTERVDYVDKGGNVGVKSVFGAVVVNGTTPATVHAAAGTKHQSILVNSHGVVYDAAAGSSVTIAGAGADTINAGQAATGTYAVLAAGDGDLITLGAGTVTVTEMGLNAAIYAGSGPDKILDHGANDTLFGSAGENVTLLGFGSTSVVEGAGAETVNAAADTGQLAFFGGGGNDVVVGGSGNSVFIDGTGNATVTGGAGTNLYQFLNDPGTDRVEMINNFNTTSGIILLSGYSAGADQAALNSATTIGGNTVVTLMDGTQILFAGAPTLHATNFA